MAKLESCRSRQGNLFEKDCLPLLQVASCVLLDRDTPLQIVVMNTQGFVVAYLVHDRFLLRFGAVTDWLDCEWTYSFASYMLSLQQTP